MVLFTTHDCIECMLGLFGSLITKSVFAALIGLITSKVLT